MWLDEMDRGGRGIMRPAVGPLGRALRGVRQQLLLSQESLAKAAGVTQAQVSRIELGAPRWTLFCRLVETVGGVPVVTIEPLPAAKEQWDRLALDVW